MARIDELTVNHRPGWKETEDPGKHLPNQFRFFALGTGDGRIGFITVDSDGDTITADAEDWDDKRPTPLKTFKGISQTNLDAALDLVEQHYQS